MFGTSRYQVRRNISTVFLAACEHERQTAEDTDANLAGGAYIDFITL
jgi:hypothetical protein